MAAAPTHPQVSSRDTTSSSSITCRNVSGHGRIAFGPNSGIIGALGIAAIMSVATATPSPSNAENLKSRGTLSSRDSNDSSGSSLIRGAIAGIVIGVIVFFAILEFLWERERIMTWIRQKKYPHPPPYQDPESIDSRFPEEPKTNSTATAGRPVVD